VLARHPLLFFFLFAYGASWLVWSLFVLSRDGAGVLPFNSPLGYGETIALGTYLGPFLAAFVTEGVTNGAAGRRRFWQRLVQWRVRLEGYLWALVGIPTAMTLGTMVLPGMWESLQPMTPTAALRAYFPFFLYPALLIGGPLGEEPGWRGFALPRLQARFGPLVGTLILGPLWAVWHLPTWFSGQWTQPTLPNIAMFVLWLSAVSFLYTWVFNRTGGSVLLAVLVHASMDAFPNAILWPMFPAATRMTAAGFLYGYAGLLLGYGAVALALIVLTRGRLGYKGPMETTHA
jgi:uncharacterized protein